MPKTDLDVGSIRYDKENESRVLIVEKLDVAANEHAVSYDWDMSPVYVSDYESNEEYPEDDTVLLAVYEGSLPEEYTMDSIPESVLEDLNEGVMYPFPESRLKPVPKITQSPTHN